MPAKKMVASLFEPHMDIIRKGDRSTHGHKVNFATGRSGLVLEAVVEDGNPADSARCLPMLHEATDRRSTMSMLSLFREIFPGVPQNPVERNAAGTTIPH